MLSSDDNALMCQVGRDTGMGQVMRRTWLPAMMSSELSSNDPVHVELLGENYVAFRDGNGRIGLLDEQCCHRGASLTVGRVEQCGLRCIYHGWLYDTDGNILETPNVPDDKFKLRFKANSYPFREAGGLLWAYLGEPENMPQFPDYEFMHVPSANVLPTLAVIGANFVQVMEGIFDSSHLTVLHSSSLAAAAGTGTSFEAATAHISQEAAPKIEAEGTDFGFHYAALRVVDGKQETRVTSFISPCFQLNPNGDLWSALVPMSDTKTAFFQVWWSPTEQFGEEPLRSKQKQVAGLQDDMLAEYGMTRSTFDTSRRMMRSNGWRQDRDRMRQGHFTGMPGFVTEDAICVVTSGGDGIRDRRHEHLSTADLAIGHIYRTLLRSARQVLEGGIPVAFDQTHRHVRGAHASLELGADWRALVPQHTTKRTAQPRVAASVE